MTPIHNADTAPAPLDPSLDASIEHACARIAPTWPLDRMIAVNPLWSWVDQPMPQVASRLAALCGARLHMPRSWALAQWQAGRLTLSHLRQAIERAHAPCTPQQLIDWMTSPQPTVARRERITDVADAARDTAHQPRWADFITHHLSQTCAAYFDDGQAQLRPDPSVGLYAYWLRHARADLSPLLQMGAGHVRAQLRALPPDPQQCIAQALHALGVPDHEREAYLLSLLLDIQGWAAWCAYLRWQARLAGQDDDHIVQLLAMRLAWERVMHDGLNDAQLAERWRQARQRWAAVDAHADEVLRLDALLLDAAEIAYQSGLCQGLMQANMTPPDTPPAVQAVFCIDVRSEVFRRALEGVSRDVQTIGFAGFFGLPLAYEPVGAPSLQPRLPGLLAPQLRAADADVTEQLAARRTRRLQWAATWKQFNTAPVSAFSFVESLGLLFGGKLLGDSLGVTRPVAEPDSAGLSLQEHLRRRPRLMGTLGGSALDAAARTALAAGVLRGMGLTRDFAPLVALIGHASQTVNNPYASALDCGACCGHTGEVSARAAAALLNDAEVRHGLAAQGIDIPPDTWFVAGLHNTTTDTVALFDTDEAPPALHSRIAALARQLGEAGAPARAERAARLQLAGGDAQALLKAVQHRARDWAQVRPEWGLANCAAFIAAPRARSRHLRLDGRAFLHDYDWQRDPDDATLELIMTAPMVVAHWINMQYYTSTVDNARYGSGNKLLHNVVGGHLGVFEGNGGDLRIGLPLQSLHDGQRWMHEPLRLSVFIEAPRAAIERVLARHTTVRQLVEHGWLHLLQIDGDTHAVHARVQGQWQCVCSAQSDEADACAPEMAA